MDNAVLQRFKIVQKIIKQSGKIAIHYFNNYSNLKKEIKNNPHDIVTIADNEIENYIIEKIKKKFPNDSFMGEESGLLNGEEYLWVIDPIDGTSNFVRGIPYYCISIALVCNNKILIGVIYNPSSNELFYALNGEGAFLNQKKIKIEDSSWNTAVIGLGRSERYHSYLHWKIIPELLNSGAEYRYMGSAALNLANVAAGKLSGYYEHHLYPWDALAGLLIAKEAGADTIDFMENEWIKGNVCFAFSKSISKKFKEIINNIQNHKEVL